MTPTEEPIAAEAPVPRARAWFTTLAFVALIALGPLANRLTEPVKTRAVPPAPEWSWDDFVSGAWTAALQDYLSESSLVTTTIRGIASETLELLGLHEAEVEIGRGGRMFSKFTLHPEYRRARGRTRRIVCASCGTWSRGRSGGTCACSAWWSRTRSA